MAPRPSLDRLQVRPQLQDWKDDELITLIEAAALFFPAGPMSANGLRIAHRRGELAATSICGRLFTTPRDVKALTHTKTAAVPGGPDRTRGH